MTSRSPVWTSALLLVLAPVVAHALLCKTNPGGPEKIVVGIQPAGSDIDIGWTADGHNIGVPAGSSIEGCLANCNLDSDPLCDISGQPGGVSAGTANLGPPLPLFVNNRMTPVCVLFKFLPPGATGTANIQTGEITGSATVQALVYLGGCPQCSGASAGAAGTCTGGATSGAACTTDQLTTATSSLGPVTFAVSRNCLPSGLAGSLQSSLTLTTGTSSQAQPCPLQSAMDDDECGVGTCTATCTAPPASGGINQSCCSASTTTPCFPATVTRTGVASPPAPAWPDATYPKSSATTLVSAFCAPGHPLIDPDDLGVPGPGAVIFASSVQWTLGDKNACDTAADCGDADACTQDLCTNQQCAHPLVAGLAGAQCLLNRAAGTGFCPGTTIDPKLAKAIKKALASAKGPLGKAGSASGKKRVKLLRMVTQVVQRTRSTVAKAARRKKKPLAAACAAEIDAALATLGSAVAGS